MIRNYFQEQKRSWTTLRSTSIPKEKHASKSSIRRIQVKLDPQRETHFNAPHQKARKNRRDQPECSKKHTSRSKTEQALKKHDFKQRNITRSYPGQLESKHTRDFAVQRVLFNPETGMQFTNQIQNTLRIRAITQRS